MIKRIFKSYFFVYLCISVIAVTVFCGIYGTNILNPTYVDWLMSGGDLSQHYLGWVAYRKSKWYFPIGMLNTLAYPYKTSIIFTDSIPIVAFIFKILSPILPNKFQYFGLWGISCFVLQGICAARIIRYKTNSKLITILASSLFLFSPIMIYRLYYHTALAGQWIILYALDIIINPEKYKNKNKLYFTVAKIGILSASIHLYITLMTGIIIMGYILLDFLKDKKIKRSFSILAIYLISIAFITWIFGGFSSGVSATSEGLGTFSFNLINFINPLGWSRIFKDYSIVSGRQYEGFAYLGAGVIMLIILAIYIFSLKCDDFKKKFKEKNEQIISIVFILLVSILFAASPKITYGTVTIIEYWFPWIILKIWSIFRATGRIIWVAVYLIILIAIIVLLKEKRKRVVCCIFATILILQIYDISDILNQTYLKFKDKVEYETYLTTTDFWNQLASNKEIEHILYYSSVDQNIMYSITDWAMQNDKTVNDFYFARSIGGLVNENRESVLNSIPDDTIIIFSENDEEAFKEYNLHCYKIDGLIVGYVKEIDGFEEFKS